MLSIIPMSGNSHGCIALVTENKLPYTFQPVDPMKGESRTPEFLAKNPFHCLPTLETEGLVIWESHAVLQYLCNKHELDQWRGKTLGDRAKVNQALDWRHCSLYPNIAKCCYGPVGFAGRDAKKEKEGVEGVKADLAMFEQYYLKDGKFVGGFATPTIADLSICGGLTFLRVLGYEHTPATKAYLARVAAAVPSWTATTAPLNGYIDSLLAAAAAAPAPEKKEKKVKEPKAAAAAQPSKKEQKEADAAKAVEKQKKACVKEGGKKGQDIAGMASFGCHFFLTSMIEPNGDLELLRVTMDAANVEVDPEGEDRKGGSGDLAKIFFTASDDTLAILAHFPVECDDKGTTLAEFMAACLKPAGASMTPEGERAGSCIIKGDGATVFTLKLRDECIAAGFEYLRSKQLIMDDDDSGDDINFADDCGVDLNASAGGGSDY